MTSRFTLALSSTALAAALCSAAMPASAGWADALRQTAAQLAIPAAATTAAPAEGQAAATAATPTAASLGAALLGSALGTTTGGTASADTAAPTVATAASSVLSALGLPAAGTASNAAGVLGYCVKNNYLNVDKATALKDQLLQQLGLGTTTPAATEAAANQDQGYLNGLAGMIIGADGQTFSLDQIKSNLKEKACDFVLNNAKSLL